MKRVVFQKNWKIFAQMLSIFFSDANYPIMFVRFDVVRAILMIDIYIVISMIQTYTYSVFTIVPTASCLWGCFVCAAIAFIYNLLTFTNIVFGSSFSQKDLDLAANHQFYWDRARPII